MIVDALVEGLLDEIVARTLIRHCGHTDGTVYGKQGISYIQSKLAGFNVQAKFGNPLLVLVDFVDTRSPGTLWGAAKSGLNRYEKFSLC